MKKYFTLLAALVILVGFTPSRPKKKYKALLIEGQNNHRKWTNYPETNRLLIKYLEETGMFTVDVATSPEKGGDMKSFRPEFGKYDLVVSNYNGEAWSDSTNMAFDQFVKNGGGFVLIHSADNCFGKWTAYNKMIGIGWGRRGEPSNYVYYSDEGKLVKDTSAGSAGHHGLQHEFTIKLRDKKHPITKGMPEEWLHAKDELYDHMRGPAENMNVLATTYSDTAQQGSGRHEPMMMTIQYGKGRVFHTPMGHSDYSMTCVGFITAYQRGAEWAVSGKVTQAIPKDFPAAGKISVRP